MSESLQSGLNNSWTISPELTDIYHALDTFLRNWSQVKWDLNGIECWFDDTQFAWKVLRHQHITQEDALMQAYKSLNESSKVSFLEVLWGIFDAWLEQESLLPEQISAITSFSLDNNYFSLWEIINNRISNVAQPALRSALFLSWIYFLSETQTPSLTLLEAFLIAKDRPMEISAFLIVTLLKVHKQKATEALDTHPLLLNQFGQQLKIISEYPDRLKKLMDVMTMCGWIPEQVRAVLRSRGIQG